MAAYMSIVLGWAVVVKFLSRRKSLSCSGLRFSSPLGIICSPVFSCSCSGFVSDLEQGILQMRRYLLFDKAVGVDDSWMDQCNTSVDLRTIVTV
jgi:hypothetical protein